jgi:hypothetical protein
LFAARLRVAAVVFAAAAIHTAPAAATSFNGIEVDARLISIDTTSESATVRIEPIPAGSFQLSRNAALLTQPVVLYTNTVSGSLAHNYRAGAFMDPFEATVPLEGNTSTYPFHHLRVEIDALAATAGGISSGKPVPVRLHVSSDLSGYRASPRSVVREGTSAVVRVVLRVSLAWPALLFVVFIMAVMWALALAAIAVAVNLVMRRRRFEGSFAGFLAALLFAFPTVRNALPGIPPVGVLFDYAAFFWAEAIVALALVTLITGWTVRALVGTADRKE